VPRTKQRTPELREQLLAVAVDVLDRDGVGGFTTRRVAHGAATSTPAVYELFGDKAGLVREVFFEGFRRLGTHLAAHEPTDDPRADVVAVAAAFRSFARAQPALVEVMFSRPFADFDPRPSEAEAGRAVRELIVGHLARGVEAGLWSGDPTDLAHALFCLVQGLAAAEASHRLGTSTAALDRRWAVAVGALLDGLAVRDRPARAMLPG
jgi:AcrR family transcriptional regulator